MTVPQPRVPAEPFVAWLNRRLDEILAGARDERERQAARLILASRLGVNVRTLYSYLRGLRRAGRESDSRHVSDGTFPAWRVEAMLDHAGYRLEDVYTGIDDLELVDSCPNGHPYTAENTTRRSGYRACLTCQRGQYQRARERDLALRGAAA